jgi:hypothetical protein
MKYDGELRLQVRFEGISLTTDEQATQATSYTSTAPHTHSQAHLQQLLEALQQLE